MSIDLKSKVERYISKNKISKICFGHPIALISPNYNHTPYVPNPKIDLFEYYTLDEPIDYKNWIHRKPV